MNRILHLCALRQPWDRANGCGFTEFCNLLQNGGAKLGGVLYDHHIMVLHNLAEDVDNRVHHPLERWLSRDPSYSAHMEVMCSLHLHCQARKHHAQVVGDDAILWNLVGWCAVSGWGHAIDMDPILPSEKRKEVMTQNVNGKKVEVSGGADGDMVDEAKKRHFGRGL